MKLEGTACKRFALLLACRDSEYVKKAYGGYLNVFVRAFGDEGETWDLFRVVDGEFPDVEDLHRYDGFVVSGSPYDAHGDDLWILRLCLLLQTLDEMRKRVLGICFGHQVLCRALGGRVGRASGGWDLGIRKVTMARNSRHCSLLRGVEEFPSFTMTIIECHQDEVLEVPMGAEVIAFSEKTAVEGFVIEEHIMGIQGHPEYTKDILFNIIDRLANNNVLERDFADEAKLKAEGSEPDRWFWEKLCKEFLKGKEEENDDNEGLGVEVARNEGLEEHLKLPVTVSEEAYFQKMLSSEE